MDGKNNCIENEENMSVDLEELELVSGGYRKSDLTEEEQAHMTELLHKAQWTFRFGSFSQKRAARDAYNAYVAQMEQKYGK